MTVLKIIGWGHRRATDPLMAARDAFTKIRPDIDCVIDIRPLSDFEHQGMAGVARSYDMVVFDHPFCGDIASGNLFVALDKAIPDLLGPDADARYVGPSLGSYRLMGGVWGAPIDAATQNALYRADLLDGPVPTSWDECLALGKRLAPLGRKLGMAVETPHALLTIASLMANAGKPWTADGDAPFRIDRDAFLVAYARLQVLLEYCPAECHDWNSIDLHEAMVARDNIVFCPAVYGYATYAEADQRRRLSFAPFTGAAAPYGAGSTIGGTALGVSRYSQVQDAAIAFATFMLGREIQDRLIPAHHGQAALLSSWTDAETDARFNGYFSATLASMNDAWIRPRRPGYPAFQRDAGRIVAAALRAGTDGIAATEEIIALAAKL